MEEEKASAYYQEMVRKGSGAARLKQGLGFNHAFISSSPNPEHTLTFVKSDPVLTSKLEKESMLASVRNKLTKQSKNDGDGDMERFYSREKERKSSHGHDRGRDRDGDGDRDRDRYRDKDRVRDRYYANYRSRINQSRSRSRSPSPGYCKSQYTGTDDDADRDGRGYGRLNEKSDRRRRHRDTRSSSVEPERKICSINKENKESKRSSCVRDFSPESCSEKHRSKDNHQSRPREGRVRSPLSDRREKADYSRKEDTKSLKKEKLSSYSSLIPGYNNMTAAEKVKARMKFQLSETVAKDTLKGMSTEWERFDFNRDAPLDDDAKLDHFGDGTGALDDIEFLQNTGSTLLSSASQARREAQIQAAHDAAIFGPPQSIAGIQNERHDHTRFSLKELDEDIDMHKEKEESTPSITSLVNEQVLSMQQGSWRQRAMKLKQERTSNTTT